jgi:hypothetical protein
MALLPKISLTIPNTCCEKIDICETTGIYVNGANDGGWINSAPGPNIDTTEVVTGIVTVYDSAGTALLQTFDIKNGATDLYPSATPPQFQAYSGAAWNQSDGIFKVVYTVIDATPTTYTNDKQYVLFLCNLQNCIDNLIAKLVIECDPDTLEELKNTIDQLEILIYGIKSAFACNNFTRAETLLANAKIICDTVTDCQPCCGDC